MKLRSSKWLLAFAGFTLINSMVFAKGSHIEKMTLSGLACEGEHFSDFDQMKPIYSLSIVTEKGKGVDRLSLIDTDNNGKVFSTQVVDFEKDVPKSFTSTNPLLDQVNQLTVTDKLLILETTQKGKTKKREIPRPKLFAVGPSLNRIIADSMADLTAGKSISFTMVIVDQLTTYGFRFIREKVSDHEPLAQLKSGEWIKLRMEIEDPLLGNFAPKIYFIVDGKTGLPYFVSSPIPSPEPGVGMLGRGTIRYQVVRSGK